MNARRDSLKIRRWLVAAMFVAAASPLGCARTPRDLFTRVWGRPDQTRVAARAGTEASAAESSQNAGGTAQVADAWGDPQSPARFTLSQIETSPASEEAANRHEAGRGDIRPALAEQTHSVVTASNETEAPDDDPFAQNESIASTGTDSTPAAASPAAPHNPWEPPQSPSRNLEPKLEDTPGETQTAAAEPVRKEPQFSPASELPSQNSNVFTADLGSQLKKLRGDAGGPSADASKSDQAWETDDTQAVIQVEATTPQETRPPAPPQAQGAEFAETHDLVPIKSQDLGPLVRPADAHPSDLRQRAKKQVIRARELAQQGRLAEAYYLARSAAEEAERGGVVFLPDDDQPGPLEQELRNSLNIAGWGGNDPKTEASGEDAALFDTADVADAGAKARKSRPNQDRVVFLHAPSEGEPPAAHNARKGADTTEAAAANGMRPLDESERFTPIPVKTTMVDEMPEDDHSEHAEPKHTILRVSANQPSTIGAEQSRSGGEAVAMAWEGQPHSAVVAAAEPGAPSAHAADSAPVVLPDGSLADFPSEVSVRRSPWVPATTGLTAVAVGFAGIWWWRRSQTPRKAS